MRFALKPLQRLTVFGEHFGEELQRHEAMEFGVFGLIDHTHPPATELLENPIVRNGLADHGGTYLAQ